MYEINVKQNRKTLMVIRVTSNCSQTACIIPHNMPGYTLFILPDSIFLNSDTTEGSIGFWGQIFY